MLQYRAVLVTIYFQTIVTTICKRDIRRLANQTIRSKRIRSNKTSPKGLSCSSFKDP